MQVKFLIRKSLKQDKSTIHVRVRAGRAVDISIATKETSTIEDWDSTNNLLKETYLSDKDGKIIIKRDAETKKKISENKKTNYRLIELKKEIEEKYKISNQKVDRDWLENIVYPERNQTEELNTDFLNYFDTYISSKGSNISKTHLTKIKSIKAIIERYLKNKNIKQIELIEINNSFKNDFEKYCTDIERYSINYIERTFKYIKTILYHAQQNGHEIYAGLNKIKCKTEKTKFEILNYEELDKIEKTSFSDEHLETAKDWLIISCYCGQRVSDFMNFDTNQIIEREVKGRKRLFIEFIQQKTDKQVFLPLHDKIIEILKKRDWKFPRKMSSTKYNLHIKTVCEYAGIDNLVEGSLALKEESIEHIKNRKKNNRRKTIGKFPKYKLITSHIGRRTFASLNYGKIPTPLLMVATGHSTPQMLMKYIGKIDEQQSLALAEYF